MISAVLFDLDGTLVDRDGASARWFEALLQARPDLAGGLALAEALARYRALDARGYADRARFCREVVAAFPGVAESPAAFWEAFRAGVAACTRAEPGALDLLSELGRRVPVAILTNGSSQNQRTKLRSAGLDHVPAHVSEELGVEKPDPRAFAAALASLGATASETLFVGDHPELDIAGAKAAGLKTCWIARGRPWSLRSLSPDLQVDCVGHLRAEGLLR